MKKYHHPDDPERPDPPCPGGCGSDTSSCECPKPCDTCGGSGEIETGFTFDYGDEATIDPCPDCTAKIPQK